MNFINLFYIFLVIFTLNLPRESSGSVLNPPYFNLAEGRKVEASATCGELADRTPVRELYCSLAGATAYSPRSGYYSYSYNLESRNDERFQELRIGSSSDDDENRRIEGGQNCRYCDASRPGFRHPAEFMVDGSERWWQSPPLSRGMSYNQINITIDLGQEFHVAYVSINMANSPRPGVWVLERSKDHGITWQPWQYFAENSAQCAELFGEDTLRPILDDSDVICSTDHSRIVPLENGEIFVTLVNNRPNRMNFSHSQALQLFTRATNIRIRLLQTKTLQGHLMDLATRKDPTITRRYFYSIKEIEMGGRCVCHGHAQTCDILDQTRPRLLLCRCEHNTCGDQCERCCPGFEQKKWQPSRDGQVFECEPCNCFGHSQECQYDETLEGTSLDIHGNYEGGGRCINCQHNTKGINCNQCKFGFYRPAKKHWNETDVCHACQCDPFFHTGGCEELTGKCECKASFVAPNCDSCAKGYYDYPECKPCDCHVTGTKDEICLPENEDGQCPCKERYGGQFCNQCAAGYFNFSAECIDCQCDSIGALNQNCSLDSGQCVCKGEYGGLKCAECADGYYNFPDCEYCDCDPSGTEEGRCNKTTGECLCKQGYTGDRCDQCNDTYWGYPTCQPCNCDLVGCFSPVCNSENGQCPCLSNFTGQQCDRCSAGFYSYPQCAACNCVSPGSQGVTCDDSGTCFCKPNFDGEKCQRCKENFYNYPICEECNCDPNGVSEDFAGCDKVPPGELCTCKGIIHKLRDTWIEFMDNPKERVTGRICNQCLPTYWNLKYHNPLGCNECACYLPGTVSKVNLCDQNDGQCRCKANVAGRACVKCERGFFDLQPHKPFGCSACQCDVGGAMSEICDGISGQCRCKPRITGTECTEPIDTHFFPDLWHNLYEAEQGRVEGNQPVRFAIDASQFANYSWRGFAVFSPVQDEIILDVDVTRPNVFRVLFHYANPTDKNIPIEVELRPIYTHSQEDVVQKVTFQLPPTKEPKTIVLTKNGAAHPFVLNPERWGMYLRTRQRIYLDYVVLLPSAYYEGILLKDEVRQACEAAAYDNSTCSDLRYPALPIETRATSDGIYRNLGEDSREELDEYPEIFPLPETLKQTKLGMIYKFRDTFFWSSHFFVGNESEEVLADITVEQAGGYVVLMEYFNPEQKSAVPVRVKVGRGSVEGSEPVLTLHHCPYSSPCREAVTRDGQLAIFQLNDTDTATVSLNPSSGVDFGISSITVVQEQSWDMGFLVPKEQSVRKEGKIVNREFLNAPNSAVIEVESGRNENKSISGQKLPFPVADASGLKVLALDSAQATIDVTSTVPNPGHYIFIVHYFNPENVDMKIDGLLQDDHVYETYLAVEFCPSVTGCRAVIKQKSDDVHQFFMRDKFMISLLMNPEKPDATIYLDSVAAVPFHMFTEELLKPLPIDKSGEFVAKCSANNFKTNPETVSDYCKKNIFSLTTDYNVGAFSCGCDMSGSTSFMCEKFGGQCPCRENVIGRQCTRCRSGFYNFPLCKACNCRPNQQCHPETGQCFCPLHVEGTECDRCKIHAFGYDPLIGCQLCDCHPDGSEGGRMECDQDSGQCLCKVNVGGRKCDKCLAGFYGFPHCYPCSCENAGSTPEICNQNTAQCTCKENVGGQSCESCVSGTFNLETKNPKGCMECFCFGTTDRCQSSYLKKTTIMEMNGWSSSDLNATEIVEINANSVKLTRIANGESGEIYFGAPSTYLGKQISSYGGRLSYELAVTPENDQSTIAVTSPDVRIQGHNMTLEYWAAEQPADPKEKFQFSVDLLPDQWMEENGSPVTRAQLMLVLNNLMKIQIKASYYDQIAETQLWNVRLDTAIDDPTRRTNGDVIARSVEMCQCPPPYKGSSCEECAEGYYRVSSGPYLGACVPCQCNGHSDRCDPDSGKCHGCQHDTIGVHCELCAVGFYGNATHGTPSDCSLCPCPLPTDENNFATSCVVDEYGQAVSCTCFEGYTGPRCDMCDTGFFGEPTKPYSGCEPCFCNENNDLSVEGSCDRVTGMCSLCVNSTSGPRCEFCAPWFHGDAIEGKNCSACPCDQCGSLNCDRDTGKCACHPQIEGENCDRCVANAWGFFQCRGCQMCNCAEASMTPQCDGDSGQCACMPGVEGQRCDRCKHGFWNYGADGCQRCDCEADLSMGTVCDVISGQCHCQEGATGPRCDKCIAGYLRVPEKGCLPCDECVHVLKYDLDMLTNELGFVNGSVRNLSTDVLTGARLSRINQSVVTCQERADKLVNKEQDFGLVNMVKNGSLFYEMAKKYDIQADRLKSQGEETARRGEKLENDGLQAKLECEQRKKDVQEAVGRLENLVQSLKDSSLAQNRERFLKESEKFLDQIKATNLTETEDRVMVELENATSVLKKVQGMNKKLEGQEKSLDEVELEKLDDWLIEYIDLLANTQQDNQEWDTMNWHLNNHAKKIKNEVQESSQLSETCRSGVTSGFEYLNSSLAILKDYQGISEALPNLVERFNDSARKAQEKSEGLETELPNFGNLSAEVRQRAEELENQKDDLQNEFNGVKTTADQAVKAAKAYSNITDSLKDAQKAAQNASVVAFDATELGNGKETEAKDSKETSANLARSASEVRSRLVNNITKTFNKQKERLGNIKEGNIKGKKHLNDLKNELDKLAKTPDLDSLTKNAEKAQSVTDSLDKYLEEFKPRLERLENETKIGDKAQAELSMKSAKQQLNSTLEKLPEATNQLNKLQKAASNASDALNEVDDMIEELKRKIAQARDMANRIKVGAKFQSGSSLRLENPARITQSAAYTLISLYFKTTNDGLLLYFGNEAGSGGNRLLPTEDFLALEIERGRPKLTVDLGDSDSGPIQIRNDRVVSDGKWHKVTVERTGKLANLKVETQDEEPVLSNGTSSGTKSVLNLHQEVSKFYVGGVPNSARMPRSVITRHFVGSIEDIRYHGDPIGLWNFALDGRVETYGSFKRKELVSATTNPGVRLSGNGYVVLNRGTWNPRKNCTFRMSFKTYATEGLLFYLGKEPDFMSLELTEGFLSLKFNLGSGLGKLRSEKLYNDGQWHWVIVMRIGKDATMEVDGAEEVKGSAPGDMFELGVSDVFYVGGLTSGISNNEVTSVGLSGCIDNVYLDEKLINLNDMPRAALGVEAGCPDKPIRVVEFGVQPKDGERGAEEVPGRIIFENQDLGREIEVTLRFKTTKSEGMLVYMGNEAKTNTLGLQLSDGFLFLENQNNGDSARVRVELTSASDGHWHFVTCFRNDLILRLDVDDQYSNRTQMNSVKEIPSVKGSVYFGSLPEKVAGNSAARPPFIGCLGDVTFGGKFLDFAQATNYTKEVGSVSLVGCTMEEAVPTLTPPTPGSKEAGQRSVDSRVDSRNSVTLPVTAATRTKRDVCALSPSSLGVREDSIGTRFGLVAGSRLEFQRMPDAFDTESEFSMEFRATASNGVLLFATDPKLTDYIAIYLKESRLVFTYRSGDGPAFLRSQREFLDGEWHTVRTKRSKKQGWLYVDEKLEARGESPGTSFSVNTEPPVYVGGLPPDVGALAYKAIEGVQTEFGGCLRNYKLNNVGFGQDLESFGTVLCSEYTENGLYFGPDGGFAVLQEQLYIGPSFSLEMELKPRVKNAVILAISAGNGDFLTLQIVDGILTFALDNGAGKIQINHQMDTSNALCDGHWHRVKIFKTKNLMTMAVDGRSVLQLLKKQQTTATDTNDPLYLGGVPDGYSTRGLETRENFIGCVRVVSFGSKPRKKKNLDLNAIRFEGDVTRDNCPVN